MAALSEGSISIDTIFNMFYQSFRNSLGYPLGEILVYFHDISDDSLKKLDSNNILVKQEYIDLYNVIGDKFTNFYRDYARNPNNKYNFPTVDNDQFMVPDLTGRYLVQRIEGQGFVLTQQGTQAFKITIPGKFARLSNYSSSYNNFKGLEKSDLALQEVKNPIKEIKLLTEINNKNTGDTIDIDNRNCIFYMRVK